LFLEGGQTGQRTNANKVVLPKANLLFDGSCRAKQTFFDGWPRAATSPSAPPRHRGHRFRSQLAIAKTSTPNASTTAPTTISISNTSIIGERSGSTL
jgi:hypothetical protein